MKLELFKKETCPYCQKVMKFIASTGRTDIIYRDVVESEEADYPFLRNRQASGPLPFH